MSAGGLAVERVWWVGKRSRFSRSASAAPSRVECAISELNLTQTEGVLAERVSRCHFMSAPFQKVRDDRRPFRCGCVSPSFLVPCRALRQQQAHCESPTSRTAMLFHGSLRPLNCAPCWPSFCVERVAAGVVPSRIVKELCRLVGLIDLVRPQYRKERSGCVLRARQMACPHKVWEGCGQGW